MPGYNIILNEGDTADLVIDWADYTGASFVAAGWYKIVDVGTADSATTHGEVLAKTEFGACTSLTITLTKDVTKIVTTGNILEKKLVMVSLTYATSKQKTEEYAFWVKKLNFLAADGVV